MKSVPEMPLLCKGVFSTRAIIWIMIFTCTIFVYVLRINMSIIILAMVEPARTADNQPVTAECKIINGNSTNATEYSNSTSSPDYGLRYSWNRRMQGLLLGSYFWGFVMSAIPGGALAERFGPTNCITMSFAIGGTLTMIGPWVASLHPYALFATRLLVGLSGGIVYPCLHCLVSRWAPPEEKGKFITSVTGGSLGTILVWPVLGAITENFGWNWAFYSCGIMTYAWTFLWFYGVSDSPETHPKISSTERKYIIESLSAVGQNKKKKLPPYIDIATSIPVWALIVSHFGSLWGLFFLLTAGPTYISSVLGFNLGHSGFLAALPYVARLLAGFIFGSIGDVILQKNWMSRTTIRKTFTLSSHLLPGVLLFVQTLTGCDVTWSIVLITMSLGLNGATTITNLQNAQELAPNFAGTIYGFLNAVGSTSGIISPAIVGYITAEHNGLQEWHKIFYLGASVYIFCGVIFCIFGSGETQPWNNMEATKETDMSNGTFGIENIAFENVEKACG